ncbi:hypothetical protein [uncultured Nitratireductor sp.]|uniref:hypothetical protein n=1 Tax=uncultured Nitratireductor sp. TaxID=520953 RepID=UPI002611B07E|nr:hypothetical protein [uncultured Nitratireductor sp.]
MALMGAGVQSVGFGLCPFGKGHFFGLDLASQFNCQIFAPGATDLLHRGVKKALAWEREGMAFFPPNRME